VAPVVGRAQVVARDSSGEAWVSLAAYEALVTERDGLEQRVAYLEGALSLARGGAIRVRLERDALRTRLEQLARVAGVAARAIGGEV
jgi:hypothetical protein